MERRVEVASLIMFEVASTNYNQLAEWAMRIKFQSDTMVRGL